MRQSKRKSKPAPEIVELKADDLMALDERIKAQLEDADYEMVKLLIASHRELFDLLRNKDITLARLRKM